MRIVKWLLVGACLTAVSASFADSKTAAQSDTKMTKQHPESSFTTNTTYICPGIAPINIQSASKSDLYAAIAEHLNTMAKKPDEYKCTFKFTGSSWHFSQHTNFNSAGFLILKNPSVAGNEKSGFILMADKLIEDSTSTDHGTGPNFESTGTGKNHKELSKFNSLKNKIFF